MKKKHFLFSLFAMIASLLILTNGSTSWAEEKTYDIGTDLTFAPFEFQDSNDEYIGIDIDLLNAIAEDQGFKVNLKPLGFDSAIQAVQSGQIDGMIAGMSITDERKKSFDFSESYFNSGLQMAVKQGNDTIENYDDLDGKTVAAKVGTESAAFLEKNQDKYGYSIKNFDDATGLYQALQNGEADAIFDDYPVLGYAITNGQKLQLVGAKETGSSYGFAVKKGQNPELIEMFNDGLEKLKEDGTYDKIIAEYISSGSEDAEGEMKQIEPKKDVYTIASDSTFAPFEFQNSDGEYEGIDVDLINRIAQLQGFTIEFKFIGFSSAVQAVESGQADGMIAGMTITDEREKSFDFSTPYFNSGIQIAVKKGNDSITSYEDLKDQTVGAKIGTESADFLEANKDKYGYKIKYLDTTDALYSSLDIGEIAAMMDDYPVIGYGIAQGQALSTPIPREEGGSYGFAVKKGKNPELIEMFNEGLAELKRTGEYDTIVGKYIKDGSTKNTVDESTFSGMIKNNWKRLLSGLWMTVQLTLISFVLALILGVIFGLFSVSPVKALRVISTIYVDIIRGIPLMVVAFFIYFGLPGILGFNIPVFIAGIITLTLNASAYISEIVRGGINAVPVGQMEASRSLGLSYNKTMRKIILPQAIKIMIPSFVNQFVISLKDTTILSAIGLIELLQTGKIIVARNLQSTMVYLIIAVMYLILITSLTKLAKVLEKRVK
ncbi:amino acid ABC transporter substrate-binding protein/permease [Enterococcus sp. BWT-B8]|uniref:amino acid ABC transporter substrate-binding protein/permease n=1 Tax=unclassified Enterococcus TaxID=2608891 RepID=UPI001E3CC920|nr:MULTISPECIES: amino acid ABC transporter substrate-binding protein/permease [unclassified Enterococcus]MCB5953063.1 amino acid ABC transporter substrate-binding protein/permease [Enterococcus sp. BWT-B8]MCB5955423.1 amino acid ABC transporter substrate-binding protein/permease [Enterococcus sp. CWB-B31]